MDERNRYQPLSAAGLAVAFAVLGFLGAFATGMPFVIGMGSMGSMMGGPYGADGYPHMGWGGFGLLGLFWVVAIAALGGAITAWVYNAIVGVRASRTSE